MIPKVCKASEVAATLRYLAHDIEERKLFYANLRIQIIYGREGSRDYAFIAEIQSVWEELRGVTGILVVP